MRSRLTQLLTVIGAATVLALAANTVSVAAGGRALLLGQQNVTQGRTTLARTEPGPVLSLRSANPAAPPFSTNARGKVRNLDADTVDGYDASALANRTLLYERSSTSAERFRTFTVPTPPPGSYQLLFSVLMHGATGGSFCKVTHSRPGAATVAIGLVSSDDAGPGLTGGGLVQVVSGSTLRLQCESGSDWDITPTAPAQVLLVPTVATVRELPTVP